MNESLIPTYDNNDYSGKCDTDRKSSINCPQVSQEKHLHVALAGSLAKFGVTTDHLHTSTHSTSLS